MMIRARRQVLTDIRLEPSLFPHTGLWLDKFLPQQSEQGGENVYKPHFEEATEVPVSSLYRRFFARWQQTLQDAGAVTAEAVTLGRLVVGLGADSVLENAITLHRTYGVPVIPGSALKGLAAHYAHNYLNDPSWQRSNNEEEGQAHKILFGSPESAGYVIFFDALYIPRSAPNNRPLAMDVVTVHHPEYYRGESLPPADWDSPNPVPFVSVRRGAKFLVALYGPEEWVRAAFRILQLALKEVGIGAKTNSGYGRMDLRLPTQIRGNDAHTGTEASGQRPNGEVEAEEETPSSQWDWRRGRISRDGRYVVDLEDPNRRYRFRREHVIPRGYTPPRKAEVQYAVRQRPDGSQVVWVKRMYYPLPN